MKLWYIPFICVTWLIRMCDMTHSYVRHDSFICATWLIHMCDMTHSYVRHDSFICVTWLIHMCDATPFMCVTALIHMYKFIFVETTLTNLIPAWTYIHALGLNIKTYTQENFMPHVWMSHVTHMNESCHACLSHTKMRHVTHMNASCDTLKRVTSNITYIHAVGLINIDAWIHKIHLHMRRGVRG